jgi:tetratricopeptide (TPR) repeat protein
MKLLLGAISVFSLSLWCSFATKATTETERTQRLHREEMTQASDSLPPPKPGLVAIHFPDLSKLEGSVSIQITEQQNSLVAAVKDPALDNGVLSEAYGTMGEVYHAYALTAPARECYLNANQLASNDFRWLYLLAKLDQAEGHAEAAILRFQTVISIQPQLLAAHVNLGNIYLELNQLDNAERSFSAALKLQKQNASAHYGLGQVALSKRSYPEAIAHFEQALALAPAANRIHYALAMAYRGLPDPEKAKAHLAQQGAVGLRVWDPLMDGVLAFVKSERLYLVRGKQAFEAKRYNDAAAEFRKALAANSASVAAHINLGAALTQIEDLKGAIAEFEKGLALDPGNTNAQYNLAVLLATSRQAKLRDGNRALKLAQSLYAATGSLQDGALVGLALSELNRCEEAAAFQEKLISVAVKQGNVEMETNLKAQLQRSKQAPSCRPPGDW